MLHHLTHDAPILLPLLLNRNTHHGGGAIFWASFGAIRSGRLGFDKRRNGSVREMTGPVMQQ